MKPQQVTPFHLFSGSGIGAAGSDERMAEIIRARDEALSK